MLPICNGVPFTQPVIKLTPVNVSSSQWCTVHRQLMMKLTSSDNAVRVVLCTTCEKLPVTNKPKQLQRGFNMQFKYNTAIISE